MDNDSYAKFIENSKGAIGKAIYYIFTIAVIFVAIVIQLGVFEPNKDFNLLTVLSNALPLGALSIIIDKFFYENGIMKGKKTQVYYGAVKVYSELVNGFDGKQISALDEFCLYFNDKALKLKRETILRSFALTYEMYSEDCFLSKSQLISKYGEIRAKAIIRARNAKVKGINSTMLTSSLKSTDISDIGSTENEIRAKHSIIKTVTMLASFILFALICVKEISNWGWAGIGLLLFKILFALGGAIISEIKGFQNATIDFVSHYNKKSDILKEFIYWYSDK